MGNVVGQGGAGDLEPFLQFADGQSGGTGAHLQRVHGAHERHTFVAPRGGGQNIAYVGVSEILALEGSGVLTCGGDGTVKLFRLTNEAFGLAGEGGPR